MDVFEYFDYRILLKELYQNRKSKNSAFSYRFIGKNAGFKSAGFFTLILQGKSNISLNMALKLAKVFKLKKKETDYFEALVLFNQAKNQSDKSRYFDKLISLKKSKLKSLHERQYEFFREWYYVAIRELLGYIRFSGNYEALGKQLVPNISAVKAKKAIQVLLKLELIKKNKQAVFERADATLTTGDIWKSMAITNFQITTMDLAKQSYDLVDPKHRDHSTLTLSISNEAYLKIKEKLGYMRKEILEIAKHVDHPDRIYQINFNAFPISKIED